MNKFGMLARGTVVAAAAAVVGFGPSASASTEATQQLYVCDGAPVSIAYEVTESWSEGFNGDVVIYNSGDTIQRWNLSWPLVPGQHINGMWNAGWAHVGQTVAVNGIYHTTSIPAAGATEFGFNAGGPSSVLPTAFTFNGVTCK